MAKKSRLGSDSLSWIKDTREETEDSRERIECNGEEKSKQAIQNLNEDPVNIPEEKTTHAEIIEERSQDAAHSIDIHNSVVFSETGEDKDNVTEKKDKQVIIFKLNNEHFAVNVHHVKEVINGVQINKLPVPPPYVSGVINLRNQIVTILNLKQRLVMKTTTHEKESTVIILNNGNRLAGIRVDEVMEMVHCNDTQVEELPATVKNSDEIITSVIKLQDVLISLLNPQNIIHHNIQPLLREDNIMQDTQSITHHAPNGDSSTVHADSEVAIAMTQFVSFFIQEDEFVVDIKEVQEINRLMSITHVPRAPRFVEGVINLRGQIVPVINLRERFSLEKIGYDKNTRIIIINIEDKQVGLVVDSVSEVLRVHESAIKNPPAEVVDGSIGFIKGIAEIGDRLVIILELRQVLSGQEIENIDTIKTIFQEKEETTEEVLQEVSENGDSEKVVVE